MDSELAQRCTRLKEDKAMQAEAIQQGAMFENDGTLQYKMLRWHTEGQKMMIDDFRIVVKEPETAEKNILRFHATRPMQMGHQRTVILLEFSCRAQTLRNALVKLCERPDSS